jgi:purine-binding chemotaxis protein CheW
MDIRNRNFPVESLNRGVNVKDETTSQFVTFFFSSHFFGLPIEDVIEINRILAITPVPMAPHYVSGVVNLRGRILTAIHLGKRIGLDFTHREETAYHNVIMGDREEPISLLVERIGDVMSVPKNQVESAPHPIKGLDMRFVSQICRLPERLLLILDSKALETPLSVVDGTI